MDIEDSPPPPPTSSSSSSSPLPAASTTAAAATSASASAVDTKKPRFSVVKIEPKVEKSPVIKISLTDDQATELVRNVSQVDSKARDKVLTHIKFEQDTPPTVRRQASFRNAFRGSKSSPGQESRLPLLLLSPPQEGHDLPKIAEGSNDASRYPQENSSLYTKRLVEKNGSSNVIPRSSKRHRFLTDFYTTLSDLKWRYCLLLSIAANISTWTLFALVYYVIISIHRDVINHDNPEWDSCIFNVNSFITCFLFSIETQHTIGYGFRAMKGNCASAIVVWNVQSYVAIMISSLFCGLIVLKIMSPQYRSRLIRFSRQAVISFNKGVPSFVFRIIDLKESNLVNCNVKAVLIRDHVTKEGEFIPFYNRSLSLSIEETTGSDLFLLWPVNVIHVIDSQSPLYGLTPRKLQDEYLEIIVILEGVVENSGKLMQVRTSYVSKEILWGASFIPMLTFNPETNRNEMDFDNFDEIQITIPQPYVPLSKRFLRRQLPRERRSRTASRKGLKKL